MISALKKQCCSHAEWQKPEGGYYLWCRLKEGLDSSELLRESSTDKVAFIPGTAFHTDRMGAEWMRLNFTYAREELIAEGIQKLKKSMLRLRKRKREQLDRKRSEETPIT